MRALAHCKPLGQVHVAQGVYLLSSAQGVVFDAGREDAPALLLQWPRCAPSKKQHCLFRTSHTLPHLPHCSLVSATMLGLQ